MRKTNRRFHWINSKRGHCIVSVKSNPVLEVVDSNVDVIHKM